MGMKRIMCCFVLSKWSFIQAVCVSEYFTVLPAEEGTGSVVVTMFVLSQIQCAFACSVNEECVAAQYDTKTHECFLSDSDGHKRSTNGDSVFLN